MKEVQQLTGRMAPFSRFMSVGGDRGHPYFQCLKRNNRFVWTKECEESFLKLKEYLAIPPVLCKPVLGTPLYLYFAIIERAIRSVLVQEQDHVQKPIYFVSARGEIPGHRKGSPSSSVLSAKAPPLLPEFHRNNDDGPPYSQGLTEARRGRTNGVLGG